MGAKAPRRTAHRILETALGLFNRLGASHVSTALIAHELGISEGNLHYHYPSKDKLISTLFAQYEQSLLTLLPASDGVRDVEDSWFFLHSLFELIWQYRFLYRDLSELLTRNRWLEEHIQTDIHDQIQAVHTMLDHLRHNGVLHITPGELPTLAHCLVVVLTYWLSFEYIRDPRRALEPEHGQAALLRGAQHALGLLAPYLAPRERTHLRQLQGAYTTASTPTFSHPP